ncbi:MAG: aminopeptidase N [Pseudomonadota bacterium]
MNISPGGSTPASPEHVEPQAIRRADYRPPQFTIERTDLEFDIHPGDTRVRAQLHVRRAQTDARELRLHGAPELDLRSISIDGRALGDNEYRVDGAGLSVFDAPESFVLQTEVQIEPEKNTALEGLYKSGGMYCTQCEAEGFRCITYYLDQPDVLSRFTTTVEADAHAYPVLLANGNLIDEIESDGRRRVTWEDPFPKPSYLFALVAGDLAVKRDQFVTMSGRTVRLEIYSEPHNIDQCDYAMGALQRSMRWDEEAYGREYDLDIYMVVAVEDFNMGAMENKGLNIFNTACVLADPATATDAAYLRVEAVVAHEYFHNWSGNRVTCRDWFQLSLKEGFTVFRDSQFSADMNAATVKRIEDVAFLRAVQFPEDAGPMAHPIRPDEYIEINNFYTTTVYEKGAEVVRMLHTLLGAEGFRRGSDLYFERHDGEAATTEDFVAAMEVANGVELDQFRRWYGQAGTPLIEVRETQMGADRHLTIEQSCAATPGQPEKLPFHMPLLLGVVDADGTPRAAIDAAVSTDCRARDDGLLIELKEPLTEITLRDVGEGDAVSLLRGFSAPVRLRRDDTSSTLRLLARADTDGFSRWDAVQLLFAREVERLHGAARPEVDADLLTLVDDLLDQALALDKDAGEPLALLATLLSLPAEADLFERFRPVDVHGVLDARDTVRAELAANARWTALCERLHSAEPYDPHAAAIARRSLRNLAFAYRVHGLLRTDPAAAGELINEHYSAADNLTDRRAALAAAVSDERVPDDLTERLLAEFYAAFGQHALVADVWFGLQATSPVPGALARVRQLEQHPAFDANNPNKLRALYGGFAMHNHRSFHADDSSGYRFLRECVAALDGRNPQVASRLLQPLTQWQRYEPSRQRLMRAELETLADVPGLSPNVFEVVSKSLGAA